MKSDVLISTDAPLTSKVIWAQGKNSVEVSMPNEETVSLLVEQDLLTVSVDIGRDAFLRLLANSEILARYRG